jgi:hypothetical protein
MAGPAPTKVSFYGDRSAGPVHSSGWLFGSAAPPEVFQLIAIQFKDRPARVDDDALILIHSEIPRLVRRHDHR